MKTKSTSLARKALASPTVVARQPRLATGRDGTDLPMPANGGNLTSTSRSSGGCRHQIGPLDSLLGRCIKLQSRPNHP